MLYHRHVVIRAEIANPGPSEIESTTLAWCKDLLETRGLKIVYGPFLIPCPNKKGMTGICAVETVSIKSIRSDAKAQKPPRLIQLQTDPDEILKKIKSIDLFLLGLSQTIDSGSSKSKFVIVQVDYQFDKIQTTKHQRKATHRKNYEHMKAVN